MVSNTCRHHQCIHPTDAELFAFEIPTAASLGYYEDRAYRLLVAPSSLITGAIVDVFRQQITRITGRKCLSNIHVRTGMLAAIMILPCLAVAIAATRGYSVLFGAEWATASVYAGILVIMLLPKFIVSPFSYMYIISPQTGGRALFISTFCFLHSWKAFYLGYTFMEQLNDASLLFH